MRQEARKRAGGTAGALAAMLLLTAPAASLAQTAGKGGTGVDEATQIPHCDRPLGVVALVEEKAPDLTDQLPAGFAALARMAEAQNGRSTAKVDPLPLIQLMAAQSGCFRVVDHSAAYKALQEEQKIAGTTGAQLVAADYLINAKVIYSDEKSRESGGGFGGAFGAVGLKSRTLESQVLLSLVNVKTGIQEAIASGTARKKDLGVICGGLLLGLGVGALGGGYTDTDIGKVTTIVVLDAFRKLAADARSRLAPLAPPAPGTAAGAGTAPLATPAPGTRP